MEGPVKRDYAILRSIYWKPRPWKVRRSSIVSAESIVRTLKSLHASKIFEPNVQKRRSRKIIFGKKELLFPFLRRNVALCVNAWPAYEARLNDYFKRRSKLVEDQLHSDGGLSGPEHEHSQETPIVEEPHSSQDGSDVEKENGRGLKRDVFAPTTFGALKRWSNTIVLDSTIVETPKPSLLFDRVNSFPLAECSPIIREVEEDRQSVITSSSLPLTSTPAFAPARTPMLLKNLRRDAAKKRQIPTRTPPKRPKRAKHFV